MKKKDDANFRRGWGWAILIVIILVLIPMPWFLFWAIVVMMLFRIPKCFWRWLAKKTGKSTN